MIKTKKEKQKVMMIRLWSHVFFNHQKKKKPICLP